MEEGGWDFFLQVTAQYIILFICTYLLCLDWIQHFVAAVFGQEKVSAVLQDQHV